jgi:hypothetical protein
VSGKRQVGGAHFDQSKVRSANLKEASKRLRFEAFFASKLLMMCWQIIDSFRCPSVRDYALD